MKVFIFCLVLFFLCSCNDKKNPSKSGRTEPIIQREEETEIQSPSISNEIEDEVIISDTTTPEANPEEESEPTPEIIITEVITYNLNQLESMGIHIVGRSTLHEMRNPPAIYCSNTRHLNQEKSNELKGLLLSLRGEEMKVMDGTRIQVILLKSLMEMAIVELEKNSDSRFCPRIYLAIASS